MFIIMRKMLSNNGRYLYQGIYIHLSSSSIKARDFIYEIQCRNSFGSQLGVIFQIRTTIIKPLYNSGLLKNIPFKNIVYIVYTYLL